MASRLALSLGHFALGFGLGCAAARVYSYEVLKEVFLNQVRKEISITEQSLVEDRARWILRLHELDRKRRGNPQA